MALTPDSVAQFYHSLFALVFWPPCQATEVTSSFTLIEDLLPLFVQGPIL
jgi:hypothetical protein